MDATLNDDGMDVTSVDEEVNMKPIVNTVLGFLMYGVNAGTVVNVKKIATQSFSLPELKEAGEMLLTTARMS